MRWSEQASEVVVVVVLGIVVVVVVSIHRGKQVSELCRDSEVDSMQLAPANSSGAEAGSDP